MLVSELFTNAVRHTASKKVGCELWMIGVRLRVEVTDQGGARRPFPPHPSGVLDMNGEYGRGLLLVGALAEEWGIRAEGPGGEPGGAGLGSATEAEEGHAVWAELHCTRRRRD